MPHHDVLFAASLGGAVLRRMIILFTVNTASGTISRYQIAANGSLTLLGSTPVAAASGVGAVDPRLSPGGPLPLRQREQGQRRRHLRRHRRHPDRAARLPGQAPRRRHPRRHHRQLTRQPPAGAAARPRLRSAGRACQLGDARAQLRKLFDITASPEGLAVELAVRDWSRLR